MTSAQTPSSIIFSFEGNAQAMVPTLFITVLAVFQIALLAVSMETYGGGVPPWAGFPAVAAIFVVFVVTFCLAKVGGHRNDERRSPESYPGSFRAYLDSYGAGECNLDPRWVGGIVGATFGLLGIPFGIGIPAITALLGFWLSHLYRRAKWRRGIN